MMVLFVVCCVLVVCNSLFVVCCLLRVDRCSTFVIVVLLLFVGSSSLRGV